jgi:hypothetical protein
MESQFRNNPIVLRLALQYHAIKKTLRNYIANIGKPPLSRTDLGLHDESQDIDMDEQLLKLALYAVEGEDTDEAVSALALYAVYMIAAVALLAGGITMAPVVAYQKFKLQRLGDLREQHNALREKVNILVGENKKLTRTINEMEVQMGR